MQAQVGPNTAVKALEGEDKAAACPLILVKDCSHDQNRKMFTVSALYASRL